MHRSHRCAIRLLSVAASCALGALPVGGQWHADVQAGRFSYEAARQPAATSVAAALTHLAATSEFAVSAGIPFSRQEPVWAAINGFRRFISDDRLRIGVDLAASGFAYRIESRDTLDLLPIGRRNRPMTGWGGSLEAMPVVSWAPGALTAETHAGVVYFTTSGGGADAADRTAFIADASLATPSGRTLAARLDARWVDVEEGGFPYAGIGLTWAPSVTLWGSVGKWLDADIPTLSWSAGASVPLGSRVSLVLNGRHDALDPVYATPARTTWGAGLSLLLGEPSSTIAEPVPAAYEAGVATIALPAGGSDGQPSIAGDFNAWTPAPMTRQGDSWTYEVAVAPGVYNYAFVGPDGEWFVPEDTPGRRDDGMGGHVAVLVVEE